MKLPRLLLSLIAAAAFALAAMAQAPIPATTAKSPQVTGTFNIAYNTRTQRDGDKPKDGVADRYTLSINAADSVIFRGTIDHQPFLKNKVSRNQPGQLTYGLEVVAVNPANPTQTRPVGRLYGTVPISDQNLYSFGEGNVQFGINRIGRAEAFESKFTGQAQGKPPAETGFLAKVKKETQTITRQVKGQTVAIAVKRYDQMEFKNLVVGAAPTGLYPEVTVNGVLLYDYDRTCWLLQNLTLTYVAPDGRQTTDRLTGSIRWIEAANRKTTGEGSYEFDCRVNEPPPSGAAVFATATDVDAFFASDNEAPSLTGSMRYKDTMSGDTVTSSAVTIALTGNRLSAPQVVNLVKVLFLVGLVPLNAE